MIIGLVLLLIAMTVFVVGSIPWLLLNYLMCFPEPSIGCANPITFSNTAKYVILFDVLLCILGVFAVSYLRKLRRRHQRRQQLVSQSINTIGSD